MRYALVVTALLVAVMVGAARVSAGPWLEKTACDSVLVSGSAQRRATFEVHNLDSTYGLESVIGQIGPGIPQSTCPILAAEAPAGWFTMVNQSAGLVFWNRDNNIAPPLLPGSSLGGFSIVFAPGSTCCFGFTFYGPYPEHLDSEIDCFQCDRPVPVIPRTWGALKVLYR